MVQWVEVLARQIFNDASDITGTRDLVHASQFFIQEVKRVNENK